VGDREPLLRSVVSAADENDAVRACRGVLPSATTTACTLKNRK